MAPVAGLAPARTRLKGEALGSLHSRAFDEMAERGGHAPHHAKCATISLAKSPGSLVRFTFQWCPRRELHSHCPRFEVGASSFGLRGRKGAPGRICTDTERGLSPLPLRWATGAKWSRRQDLHPHWTRSELVASALGYAGKNEWCSRQEFRLQPPRSKRGALYIELRERRGNGAPGRFPSTGSGPEQAKRVERLPRLPPQCRCGDLLI